MTAESLRQERTQRKVVIDTARAVVRGAASLGDLAAVVALHDELSGRPARDSEVDDELPEDFDYAGLEADLDELEATNASVKAAGDKLRATIEKVAQPFVAGDYIAVDAKGYCWRVWRDDPHWSMCPVNPDNSPIPQPVQMYAPIGEPSWHGNVPRITVYKKDGA